MSIVLDGKKAYAAMIGAIGLTVASCVSLYGWVKETQKARDARFDSCLKDSIVFVQDIQISSLKRELDEIKSKS